VAVRPESRGAGAVAVVPANRATWEDLQAVFGDRGTAARCQCQRYKLQPKESFASQPVEERAHRLRQQTDSGQPSGAGTSGLVAYLAGEPAGWCAVEPRNAFTGLVRNQKVPWQGRDEDRTDASVWALTCLLTRTGFRKRGVSRALVAAAVEHAQAHGAAALEAYPITTAAVILEELHVGLEQIYAEAGFVVVTRPTKRRTVMRLDFDTA